MQPGVQDLKTHKHTSSPASEPEEDSSGPPAPAHSYYCWLHWPKEWSEGSKCFVLRCFSLYPWTTLPSSSPFSCLLHSHRAEMENNKRSKIATIDPNRLQKVWEAAIKYCTTICARPYDFQSIQQVKISVEKLCLRNRSIHEWLKNTIISWHQIRGLKIHRCKTTMHCR